MGKHSVTFSYIEHGAGICRSFGTYTSLDDAMSAAWECARRFEHLDELTISVHADYRVVWSLDSAGNEHQLDMFKEAA